LIRTFVYSTLFEHALKLQIKKVSEVLERIESVILDNPEVCDVIQGTGGVRKMRLEIRKLVDEIKSGGRK
jgi:hypothetical protein